MARTAPETAVSRWRRSTFRPENFSRPESPGMPACARRCANRAPRKSHQGRRRARRAARGRRLAALPGWTVRPSPRGVRAKRWPRASGPRRPVRSARRCVVAAGAALVYVEETFGRELAHLRPPQLYRAAEYMLVDEVSRRHLELVISSDGTRRGSLLSVLDQTLTPVGARALQNWIVYPLLDLDAIWRAPRRGRGAVRNRSRRPSRRCAQADWRPRTAGGPNRKLRASPRDCLKLEQALRAVDALRGALQRSRARSSVSLPRGWCRCPNSPRGSTRQSATSRRLIRARAT